MADDTGTLPAAFCWSKVGAESGSGMRAILRQKEIERQAQAGLFAWGIGKPPSRAAFAALQAREPAPQVLFSRTVSGYRQVDSDPEHAVAWRAFIDPATGQTRPLAALGLKYLEICRGGYALLCHSARPLTEPTDLVVYAGAVRNLLTGKPLGQQVTAIVESASPDVGRAYPVLVQADLVAPYLVELADHFIVPAGTLCLVA